MDIPQLIKNLAIADDIVGLCPRCQEEFKLSKALFFDGLGKFPTPAEEKRQLLLEELKEREELLKKRKISVDEGAEKKAIEVGFGKIIERFIPAYKNLNLQFSECRPLFDPIDVIVFNGLLKGKVDALTFLEIKSGNARLNNHQKMIRDSVQDGCVCVEVL